MISLRLPETIRKIFSFLISLNNWRHLFGSLNVRSVRTIWRNWIFELSVSWSGLSSVESSQTRIRFSTGLYNLSGVFSGLVDSRSK